MVDISNDYRTIAYAAAESKPNTKKNHKVFVSPYCATTYVEGFYGVAGDEGYLG